MKLDFRIDFGYRHLYSSTHYHPKYIWDGNIRAMNGHIEKVYQLDYPDQVVESVYQIFDNPYGAFAQSKSAKETLLQGTSFQCTTHRNVGGIRIEAEVTENTVFYFDTVSFSASFTAKEIMDQGRLWYHIGPKYVGGYVTVTKTGYLWFRPETKKDEVIFNAEDLHLPVHNHARMQLAFLKPEESVKLTADISGKKKDYKELLIHLVAMAAPEYNPENEGHGAGDIPYEIIVDGKKVLDCVRFYRHHDAHVQMLEDDWRRIEITEGKHEIELKNKSDTLHLAISRITLKECEFNHGQLNVPTWKLKDEPITASVFATKEDTIQVTYADKTEYVDCQKGWNEFIIRTNAIGIITVNTKVDTQSFECYDIAEEKYPVKVGYDLTVVPHDKNGYLDYLLNYTHRTRLGNFIMFRDFKGEVQRNPNGKAIKAGWTDYLRKNNVYSSACIDFLDGAYAAGGKEMFTACGEHELSQLVYVYGPKDELVRTHFGIQDESLDMKDASEKFISFYKTKIDAIHDLGLKAGFGEAAGGARYAYLAGVDFTRAETIAGIQMPLLAKVRSSSESLGNGRWGVHIAIHHHHQPYDEAHLGIYFISLMQPWTMGAELIYEEDSLFELFKEERQAWDDLLTKGKRDMTRNFFKFVKTHPRKGKCVRSIAHIEGRYAAPFNGYTCGYEQGPDFNIWGGLGKDCEEWGYKQPEKCQHVLNVLMPGTITLPLRQQFDKTRYIFSGTPFGDFDMVPIEATEEYLKNYKLLMNLGWNTMIQEDYEKIRAFVKNGGTYLSGLPQYSTHIDREFLKDMEDLRLYNHGELSELSGIKVLGKGVEYCGQWNCKDRINMPEPELISLPNDNIMEDGKAFLADIELTGAEIVAWDAASGKPMLVRNKVGKGYVYTFTVWAYAGHEQFQTFSASWVSKLAEENKLDIYIEDSSHEVFWTVWENENEKTVYILNTDWVEKGNTKLVTLVHNGKEEMLSIKERCLTVVRLTEYGLLTEEYSISYACLR